MNKKIPYEVKEAMVSLSGACFWYWTGFNSFLDSCGVSRTLQTRYSKETSNNKYTVMRNILTSLEEQNKQDIIDNIISEFYKLDNAIDIYNLDTEKAKQLLSNFKIIVGNDPIDIAVRKKERESARNKSNEKKKQYVSYEKSLESLNKFFIDLSMLKDTTKQKRGFELEKIFSELLRLNEFDYNKSYKTSNEQIDGYFKFDKFDYIVEIKWISGCVKQEELSVFDAKISGKAQSTRGFFISMNGFDSSAITKFSINSPRMILMNGEDLALILNGSKNLHDVLKAKVDFCVRKGNILYLARNMN
jgi:hypothetical protein